MTRLVKPGGDYHHLRVLVVDEDGVCKISGRTIQRVLGKMNAFVRDFLLFGADYAERRHMRALRQVAARPSVSKLCAPTRFPRSRWNSMMENFVNRT
ncbi:hypothetical protein HJB84_22825 [Rhizobium sp. NZLR1b]|nr:MULTISPECIES: hypothetical protein [unclassified Rhizobium]MBX5156986.1 hypothetical protein [Rhizobium sp. NZLR8]MBX5172667.1 hypothetical protein [Rhizobium sp. NZLR1b]MBX5185071.1 hypothetical protein [Rhizobium sp. NZLR5]MBX5189234.1 hypothetical protein [Rhizobium sp. NZLR3b]MBX5197618.1 hypothetical protein [Rhizobium sp. NZLR10]